MKKFILSVLLFSSCTLVRAEIEPWYTYWAFGFSDHSYEEPLDSVIDAADALPGVSRTQIATDLFGFYWPLRDNRTILGFVVSGSSDRIDDGFDYMDLDQNLYGASIMHYFGKEIGDGFFLRGDLGFSDITLYSSLGSPISSDTGTGVLFAVGYGIPVSEQSRVLISLTVSNNQIEGYDYSTTALRIGGLW